MSYKSLCEECKELDILDQAQRRNNNYRWFHFTGPMNTKDFLVHILSGNCEIVSVENIYPVGVVKHTCSCGKTFYE